MGVVIPGLPDHIKVVPPAPASPTDPEAAQKRLAFKRWRYAVHQYRIQLHIDLHNDPGLIPFEIIKCSQHPAYWASMYLNVFEPRWRHDLSQSIPDEESDDPDAEINGTRHLILPDVPRITQTAHRGISVSDPGYDPALTPVFGWIPFICFEKQVVAMNRMMWALDQEDQYADIVWSKARGWGATWIGALLGLWGWTFSHRWPGKQPWNVLYLSRKQELVDSKQQRSIFWKIRRLMKDMPAWQMPDGFMWDNHDNNGIIINPQNGNELGGESTTTKAGRGDRVTWAWVDEAAFIPQMLHTWATLTDTTDHRFAVSTESFEEGKDFYELRNPNEEGTMPFLLEADWWENPNNDDVWLERQRKRNAATPEKFQQEIWRNPYTGSTWVYPWADNLVLDPKVKPVAGYGSYLAIDPGFRDPTAIIAIQEDGANDPYVLDSYQIEGKEADFFAPILKPDLFADVDPNWMHKDYIEWKSPFEPYLEFVYKEREIDFARTVAAMGGKPTYVGDTYGETKTGAGQDSVYSRWRKYGINVNRDRRTGDAVTKSVALNRTWPGRREAMNELSQRWKFSNKPGAALVKKAWKEAVYKARPDRPEANEPMEPLHDWTSHLRTAGEFYAVQAKTRHNILHREYAKPMKTRLGQANNFGKRTPLGKVA